MEIVILANESRKAKDKPILEEARNAFDKVEYASIKKVRFDLVTRRTTFGIQKPEISLRCNGYDLSDADCVLTIPTNTYGELFYTALRMLERCVMPFDATTYMLTLNEELLFDFLGSKGLPIRKSLVVTSNISMDKITESVKFPVLVRPPQKRVIVTNKRTLKDVISLYKYGTPILIEKPIKSERNVWVFVLEDEVIAAYEKRKNISKTAAVDDNLRKMAIKVRETVGCDYCTLRFLLKDNEWIVDKLTFSPNFSRFQKITGVNIGRHVVSHMLNNTRKLEKPAWQEKIEEIFRLRKISGKGEWGL